MVHWFIECHDDACFGEREKICICISSVLVNVNADSMRAEVSLWPRHCYSGPQFPMGDEKIVLCAFLSHKSGNQLSSVAAAMQVLPTMH